MEHVIGVVLFPELQKVKPEVNLGDFFLSSNKCTSDQAPRCGSCVLHA